MTQMFRWFVGVDLGGEQHQVALLDADGQLTAEKAVRHDGESLRQLSEWLVEAVGDPGATAVAVESPRSVVVEILVERGFAVFTVNPKQLDRFRDRHTVAGAKDDRRDAFVLATSLRTDQHRFHRVKLDDPVMIQLREMSRVHDDLNEEIRRGCNQLREQLHRAYAVLLELCPAADEPWLWALLAEAPSHAQGRRLRPVTVKRILRDHRIRRLDDEKVTMALKRPGLPVAPGVAEAAAEHIQLIIPRLQLLRVQRSAVLRRIEALLEKLSTPDDSALEQSREHRDVQILLSLPGVGRINGAAMLAEAWQPLRERDYQAARAHGGLAPVTRQSGKRCQVQMRRACNPRLRNAFYHCARTAMQSDPACRRYYASLRARGHSHGRALRSVADRQLRILFAMLRNGTTYQPEEPLLAA